jgi:hypothetical protein
MIVEFSYDLVMEPEMAFVEGVYRVDGGAWQVIIVSREYVNEPEIIPQTWDSGVKGIFVRFPSNRPLNASAVERLLAEALGATEIKVVRGPDSMDLR